MRLIIYFIIVKIFYKMIKKVNRKFSQKKENNIPEKRPIINKRI